MPHLDKSIKTILLISSGPIVIGQACEFDYSGSQAIKVLKKLGYRVILINSNPATIMTDPDFADRTYIEPITCEVVANIIKKEKVDAILPTMGGQTALNVAMQMYEKNMLHGIKFLGANPSAIKKGEDRAAFKEAMIKIGLDVAKSKYAYNEKEAQNAADEIGFPLIIRASFTLAGGGSGIAYNVEEFKTLAKDALRASPINEILIEESLIGWKEYEMEVIRDRRDNCIIVCSIENLDPMGVHTGDSITIAPALTLTDKEYQRMRDASFKILREIGVDTGGSNVQFAINPKTGRMIVIEMNPRVSRSSALASKATGYPIAKVATMLAVGYSLDEIENEITGTTASFEPSIDYIVTKIPKFTFEKFPNTSSTLSTSMKSVGEVMAIGGTFKESLQKAICSLENGLCGLNSISNDLDLIKKEIRRPNEKRLLYIADGFRANLSIDDIYELCFIDRWFLNEIKEIVDMEKNINSDIMDDTALLRKVKSYGFSDKMICKMLDINNSISISEVELFNLRQKLGILSSYNQVDTCSAEFVSKVPYLYSSIGNFENLDSKINKNEVQNDKNNNSVLIIGGGANRIGQGIEFDYCCVHASFALKDLGVKSLMYNCNPETVSTDYDTSDILYFEPIDFERVRSVIMKENPSGIIVHFGGQTPLKLAKFLSEINANIIGTSPKVIDIAEDREKFANFVRELGLNQPDNAVAFTKEDAFKAANKIGFPVLVRPSYILGGRAMRIIYGDDELKTYMDEVLAVSEDNPVLIDRFLDKALEIDIDCISDGRDIYIGGICEHIEDAGVHSGDSACVIPARNISQKHLKDLQELSAIIAINLGVIGLMNIQCAIYKDEIYLIEVNPRASRSVPFISKATGVPLAKIATRVMWEHYKNKDSKDILLESLEFYDRYNKVEQIFTLNNDKKISENINENIQNQVQQIRIFTHKKLNYFSIKESVFPFNKLIGADLLLSPEMKSTGEVMGICKDYGLAFLKSQIASNNSLPQSGTIFLSLQDSHKLDGVNLAREFINLGFKIVATSGTQKVLKDNNVESSVVLKLSEGRPHINDKITNGEIDMVINTSLEKTREDARKIMTSVLRGNIPYFTTINGAINAAIAIRSAKNMDSNSIGALQDYLQDNV